MELLKTKGIAFLIYMCLAINIVVAQGSSDDFISQFNISNDLEAPGRMAIDTDDNIYVTDAIQRRINKYDNQGIFVGAIEPDLNPLSIAINSKNELFVGDQETGNIYKVDQSGSKSLFYSGISLPNAMVFGSNKILYITDSKQNKVIGLNVAGSVVTEFTHSTFTFITGIAFDAQNDHIIVSEHGGIGEDMECGGGCSICWSSTGPQTSIYIFNLDGSFVSSFGCFGEENGLFHRIQGITVGACGNIYAVDPYLGRVSVFDPNGNYITLFGQQGDGIGDFNLPMDIVFNSDNALFISSMNKGEIDVFSIIQSLPTSTIVGIEEMICEGSTTDILVKFTGTAPWTFTYTIDGLDPVEIMTSEANYNLQASVEGKYEITSLTDANNIDGTCLTGSKSIKVNSVLPTATFLDQTIARCEDASTDLFIEFTGEAPWTFTYTIEGQQSTEITTAQSLYVLNADQEGLYEIISLSDAAGCIGEEVTGNTSVTIFPQPTSVILNGNDRIYIPEGEFTELTVQFTGTAPWTFVYVRDEQEPISITTPENPYTFSVAQEGTYEIKETSDFYCNSTITDGYPEVVFLASGYPTAVVDNMVACVESVPGVTINFTGTGPWTFTYTIDGANPTEITTSNSPYQLSPLDPGLLELVSVYDSLNNIGTVEGFTTIYPLANADYVYETDNLDVVFVNNSTNTDSHFWDFGDGTTSTEENPTHTYSSDGSYTVTYTANSINCGTAQQIEIIEVSGEVLAIDSNFHKTKKIDIYPNPSSGYFTIKLNPDVAIAGDIHVVINNTSGQNIYSEIFNSNEVTTYQGNFYIDININSFTRGIYIVYVNTWNFVEQDKLILKD